MEKQGPPSQPDTEAAARSATATVIGNFTRPGEIRLASLPPLALYVHFPWCVRKCPYCDFNSHEAGGPLPEEAYLDALARDLESVLPLVWGRRVHTVFIGGGTPSLLSAAGLDRLLSDIRARLALEADAEITMEANPGTFEAEKFRSYRASGINRLSIGIQSFNDTHLQALGRVHDGGQARAAIEIARRSFDNVNLDLMFALPGQTLAECQQDIDTALSFGTPHLSCYHLTLEPNTVFAKYPPALPDDDLSADMQDAIVTRLAEAGLQRYEVSAYARAGRRSRHNLNYWQFGDYIGIGAGAHAKLSFPNRILRQVRHRHPQHYIERALAGNAIVEERELRADDLPFEFMLNALRLVDGVPADTFSERTGQPLQRISRMLQSAVEKGLLDPDPAHIRATPLGSRFLNDLQALFLKG